ncbi:hypothetical protein QYE76_027393 [Lolium multiflorum]|uniref:Reverse transcriptase domain-containing protein n=1 Tax=Lolium multiflorum TaxID=4521 RepID=A0AAD8QJ27_LOLMU|nr:hypothetical protein QYE76_027393 [Lolium multiflorum]
MSRVGLRIPSTLRPYRRALPSSSTIGAVCGKHKGASAVPVTSAAFVLDSPTPPVPKDPIYYEPVEFASHLKPSHSAPSESSDDVTTTFGGVRFIVDSEGFLRLPRAGTSGSNPPASTEDTQAATMEIPPGNMRGAHIMEKKTRSYSYRAEPYIPEPYEPMEKDEYVPAEVFPEPRGQVSMIHKTSFSKREIKKFSREVKYAEVAMVDTPEFIDWSEQSISFDRTDHPKAVPRPGHAALVLEAQIGGYNMSKVFMDGGSGLNLLFANTMKAMGLTVDMLRESDTGFHGIIPTRPAYSLGKTTLDVVFGTPTNFRREKIEFEVVDWESQYHAILGRPAFAKFMEGALIEFLRERWEIFAWEPSDMPGFIRELKEAEWVANPVMVPKKDTTALRMCIDYTGLNKHCPKDHFPLPRIDQIVDSTAGCDRLSFLDAYYGYNQIKLKKEDQELTAFITATTS